MYGATHLARSYTPLSQERTLRLLHALADTAEVVGAQVCLFVEGRCVVDAAAGRMGLVDARPVRPDSLFQLFEAGSPPLAVLALQAAQRGELGLDGAVASTWPAFGAAGKAGLSVAALLEHTSGLSEVLPPDTKLAQLCDPAHMAACVAAAAPDASAAAVAGGPRHEGAAWGWALHGLLEAATGLPLR